MAEKFNFDFSKPEDQIKFNKLDKEDRDEYVREAEYEAERMQKAAGSGLVENYEQSSTYLNLKDKLWNASVNEVMDFVGEVKKSALPLRAVKSLLKDKYVSAIARGWEEDSRLRDLLVENVFYDADFGEKNEIIKSTVHAVGNYSSSKPPHIRHKEVAETLTEDLHLSSDEREFLFQETFDYIIGRYDIDSAVGIVREIFEGEELRNRTVTFLKERVRNGFLLEGEKVLLDGLSEREIGVIYDQENIKMGLINSVSNYNGIIKFISKFETSKDFLNSPEIQFAINKEFPRGLTAEKLIEIQKNRESNQNLDEKMRGLSMFDFSGQIDGILNAQSDAAFLYIDSIKRIRNYEKLDEAEASYISYVAKKYGTQARNILENIIVNVGAGNVSREKDNIEEYIKEIGIIHFGLYEAYKKAKIAGETQRINEMKEWISELHERIYYGDMPDWKYFEDEFYPAVSYHVFPPAIGLTQDQYDQLNEERSDRWDDVPESLNEFQYQKFEVGTGRYHLSEGQELNLDKWTSLSIAIAKVNKELDEGTGINLDEESIAERLINMFEEKSSEHADNQNYLFENMYRYHLVHGGGKLESGFEISIQGLMRYKEFIGDRIKNDLIKDCLKKWKEKNPSKFDSLKENIQNRLKNSQKQNFSKVKNMLDGIRKQKDETKKQKAVENLDEFLKNFDLSYEYVKDIDIDDLEREMESIPVEYDGGLTEENYRSEEYYNSEAFTAAYDQFLAKYDSEELAYQKISSDLVAGINKKMRREVDKFKFEGESAGAQTRELEFAVSKKKEHGVAGYNMGVCVTPDEQLWNDPAFMNCIIFDPALKQARGGMHFLIRENNLCLPGINPSLDILGQVKNEDLFDRMMEYAKKVKEKLGLERVLIPTHSGIFSNRTQIHEIVRKKNYKKINLAHEAAFSFDPHEYSFQECFEVS